MSSDRQNLICFPRNCRYVVFRGRFRRPSTSVKHLGFYYFRIYLLRACLDNQMSRGKYNIEFCTHLL